MHLQKSNILFWFFGWRVLLLIPLIIGFLFLPYRPNNEFTNIWKYTEKYFPVDNFLIFPWSNFDGVHYLSIASNGYTFDGRFFPLYPLLIHLTSFEAPAYSGLGFAAGFLISNVSFLFALILFYKLLKLDFNESTVKKSILYLLIFPASFFFVSLYAEGLFFLLLISCFYLIRKKRWFWASLMGLLLCVTRPVGLAILPVLLFEYTRTEKPKIKNLLLISMVPAGLVGFAYYCYLKWGDVLYFIHSQTTLSNNRSSSFVLFPQTVFRYLKILMTHPFSYFEWWIALLELTAFMFGAVMLYVAWKKKVRTSYLLFSLLAFLIPASTGTFSGMPRYIAVLSPLFIALALIKNKTLHTVYIFFSIALLFILLMLFARGYYVA